MESNWTKYNLKQIDAVKHLATNELNAVLEAIDKARSISDPEEQAEKLIVIQKELKTKRRAPREVWGRIAEYLAVAIYKDLRHTETVQSLIEEETGRKDSWIN